MEHQPDARGHEQQLQMPENDRCDFAKFVRHTAAQRKESREQHHPEDWPRYGDPRQPNDQLARKLEGKKRC